MTLGFGSPRTAELAKRCRAAHWLLVATVLALNWVAAPLKAAETAPCEAVIGLSTDVSPPAAWPISDVVARLSEHNETDQPVVELSDDLIATPRPAQAPDYGSSVLAGFIHRGPRPAFPRVFNPRAPPLPA